MLGERTPEFKIAYSRLQRGLMDNPQGLLVFERLADEMSRYFGIAAKYIAEGLPINEGIYSRLADAYNAAMQFMEETGKDISDLVDKRAFVEGVASHLNRRTIESGQR